MLGSLIETLIDAKAILDAHDLIVHPSDEQWLWIANSITDMGDSIKLSQDACHLSPLADRWVAGFPAAGMRVYEVPGTLSEGVSLILAVYTRLRADGGTLNEAFRRTVEDPDSYLNGR